MKVRDLAYGENPHQRAAYYADATARTHLLSNISQLHGRQLSLINMYDLNAARMLLREFAVPACVIVKHANPCGVAVGCDGRGGVGAGVRRRPRLRLRHGRRRSTARSAAELGRALADRFIDVLFATGYDQAALQPLTEKPATRILLDRERRRIDAAEKDYKRVPGGLLVQDRDLEVDDARRWRSSAGNPTRRAGATCSSPGACASTSARTRS